MSVSFADLGVPSSLVASLSARGIDAPFPIQAATIPDALAGRDICGRAPTGSGKTMAFGIPMILGIGNAKPRKPRGLVLVPTRELASQVCDELNLLAGRNGPRVEAFYGGVGFDRQIKALRRGVEIVVACPGRLADLINQRYVDLNDVDFVVIDEADRMADMGFLPEVKRLLDQCAEKRQTLLFSATLDGDVDVLIKRYQYDPARHEYIADDEGGALAEHYFWKVDRLDRLKTAAVVIKKLGPTVVFCRTKRGADRIATQLAASGVKSAAIHGDRSQGQRERALHSFHQGHVLALVATDVAARGIHVDNVAGVIHYDPPADHKDYVHRSGRTARAGNRGVVVSLVAPELRKDVATIQRELGYPIGLDDFDLSVLESGSKRAGAGSARVADTSVAVVREPVPERAPSTSTGPAPKPRGTKARSTERLGRDDRASRSPRPSAPKAIEPEVWDDEPMVAATRPAPKPVKIDRINDLSRGPLADGQRRPSGAARRKAKRLAATEAALLGTTDDSADLRDGGSSRTSKGSGWSKSSNRGESRGSNGSSASSSRGGSSSGRSSRPAGGRSSTSGPSGARGRSSGGSGSGSSRGGSTGGSRGPQAARSGSSRRPS